VFSWRNNALEFRQNQSFVKALSLRSNCLVGTNFSRLHCVHACAHVRCSCDWERRYSCKGDIKIEILLVPFGWNGIKNVNGLLSAESRKRLLRFSLESKLHTATDRICQTGTSQIRISKCISLDRSILENFSLLSTAFLFYFVFTSGRASSFHVRTYMDICSQVIYDECESPRFRIAKSGEPKAQIFEHSCEINVARSLLRENTQRYRFLCGQRYFMKKRKRRERKKIIAVHFEIAASCRRKKGAY